MSDTASGDPRTSVTDSADSAATDVGSGISLPVLASALRVLAVRTPSSSAVAAMTNEPFSGGALENAALRPLGRGVLNAVQWVRGKFLDENGRAGAGLDEFDGAYQAAGRGFNTLADIGDVAGVGGMYVAAGMLLYPIAKGIPDEQVATLQTGTAWNPEGGPQATSQLANLPFQVISVANEAQLIAAIDQVNASPGNYAIQITSSFGLTSDLPAIVQPMGFVQIDGEGNVISGSNTFRGFVVDGTNAEIQNLTIQDAVAQGGAGGQGLSGGGGGAGLGGGLLAVNNANVVLDNVSFTDDSAQGGSGGGHEAGGIEGNAGYGGGGGMGGAGAAGGAWQASAGGILGDTLGHLGFTQGSGNTYDGASGGGGGLGVAAGGATTGAGSQSSIISGAGGGSGFGDGSSDSNDSAADGGGLGAQGTEGGFGGGGGGGSSSTLGGSGGYGGGGGGGGGDGGFGGGGGSDGGGGFGGGTGNSSGGGGGAGLGGGVFADGSSSITEEGGSFSNDTATGGQGASGAGSGQGYGSSIFLAGDQVMTVVAAPGQTMTFNGGSIADQTGSDDPSGQGGTAALVAEGGGTVVLSGAATFSGGVVVTAGTTLELTDAQAAGSGNITFASEGTATLRIDPATMNFERVLENRLSGMVAGDRVDLTGLSGATQLNVDPPSTSTTTGNGEPVTAVTVSNGTQSETLLFEGLNPGATFTLASDGQGGTMLTMTQTMPTPTGLSETSTNGVLTFSGTGQAGSTVTLYQVQMGTNTFLQLGTATVGSDGQFSLSPATQPDAGAGRVVAVATDSYGNASFVSDPVSLPAGAGGSPPVSAQGVVAPAAGSIVVRVGTEAQLIAAINEANANNTQTTLAIEFTNNITLSGTEDLPALQDKTGVQIVGNGYTLQGDGNTRGLMLFGANATIDDLTISDMVAHGGVGGGGAAGGGGGAGLGGGLLVAGDSNVTIDDVHFVNDSAIGGAGGPSAGTAGAGYGGGGGLGGAGGSAMANPYVEISGGGGGIGNQATGGSGGAAGQTSGGASIVAGAPSDQSSGAAGGVSGGGGAGGTETNDGMDGGGGGIYGLSGSDTSEGGDGSTGGWGGGGGGNATYGGDGGFGGGGGGDSNEGGHGGFGGGGGGGAPLLSDTGAPGGFGGGAGGTGTNNPADSGGGGGLGAGGAVFVEAGSSLTVVNSSNSGDSVSGGQGESDGQDGQAYGSGFFIEGNQAVTLAATAGQTTTISGVIADETGSHDQSGATGAGSLIIEGPGTVALDTSNTYTGGTVIAGGTLELGAAGAAGGGNITFAAGASGTLKIDAAAMQGPAFGNPIAGFSQGDSVDLAGLASSGGTSAKVIGTTSAGTEVAISGSGGQQEDLVFQGLASNAQFFTTSDGNGGTTVTLASNTADTPTSSSAAGNASNLGSNDPRADLSVALQRTPPVPGAAPDADRGAGSAAAGPDPTPEAAHVAVPGTDDSHTIAPAVHSSEDNTSSHHTR